MRRGMSVTASPTMTRLQTRMDGHEADWLNDVQDELIAVQEELSIAELQERTITSSRRSKGIAKKLSKEVGEIFHLNHVKSPAAFDKDDPDSFFPGLCLSSIDGYTDISSSNWPDLVTNLRTRALTYNEGKAGGKIGIGHHRVGR
jgi:hypothetical protein